MKPTNHLLEEFERIELEADANEARARERLASIYRGRAVAILRPQDDDWAEEETTWPKVAP